MSKMSPNNSVDQVSKQLDLSQIQHFLNARSEFDRLQTLMPDTRTYQLENLAQFSLDPSATSSEDFEFDKHRAAYRFWAEKRGIADLPATSMIDPFQLREALGSLILLEPNAEFSDFHCRLYGSLIVLEIGDDMTGRWVSEHEPAMARCFIDQYAAAAELRSPVYSEHQYSPKLNLVNVCARLILPFAGDDNRVNRIMVCLVPVKKSI